MFFRPAHLPLYVAVAVALLLPLTMPATALAHARLHPALFALSPADFPAGSQVVRAGVETNRQLLRDQPLHFGFPPAALGRRTGYYMDAVDEDPAAASHPYTSYLVSIFGSARQAQMAFDIRWGE